VFGSADKRKKKNFVTFGYSPLNEKRVDHLIEKNNLGMCFLGKGKFAFSSLHVKRKKN
jgi:hypothetical protein